MKEVVGEKESDGMQKMLNFTSIRASDEQNKESKPRHLKM